MTELRDELRQISKDVIQRKHEEQERLEQELIKEHRKDKLYWSLCEKLWPKIWDYVKHSANEGRYESGYCVKYTDFEDSGIIAPNNVYRDNVQKLRRCLVSFIRSKGLKCLEQNVWGHNNGGHLAIKW